MIVGLGLAARPQVTVSRARFATHWQHRSIAERQVVIELDSTLRRRIDLVVISKHDDQRLGSAYPIEQLLKHPVELEQVGTRRFAPDAAAMPGGGPERAKPIPWRHVLGHHLPASNETSTFRKQSGRPG